MYNISLGEFHPSTICVELSGLESSLSEASDLLNTDYPQESVKDFIEKFARTSEIMPDDKTVGFIIINKKNRMISISATKIPESLKDSIRVIFERYKEAGFNTEFDVS